MSVRITIGNPREMPTSAEMFFWLTQHADGSVALHAKHSDDASDQTVLEIMPCGDGRYAVKRRQLFARRLLAFFGLRNMGDHLPTYVQKESRQ